MVGYQRGGKDNIGCYNLYGHNAIHWDCAHSYSKRIIDLGALIGSFSTLWSDISGVGRITSDVIAGMSVTQFIGIARIAIHNS